MKYAQVNSNLVDLWSNPKFNSERINQLFFSDILKVIKEKNEFCYVAERDGYSGWVDKRFIRPITMKEYDHISKSAKHIIIKEKVPTFDSRNKLVPPHYLLYGTELTNLRLNRDNNHPVKIKNGSLNLFVKKSGIKPISTTMKITQLSADSMITEAKTFLGTPYLWGGMSHLGIDCSGFMRIIMKRFGAYFPRDTRDQILFGQSKTIARDKIQKGDLLFFDRHVALATGKHTFIHSSIGGNGVRINSFNTINKKRKDYRSDLNSSFQQARRLF